MKRKPNPRLRQCAWTIASALLLASAGCEIQDSAESARPPRDTSPQAKYQRVLAETRRWLSPDASTSGGRFILQNEAGSGTTVTHYKVVAPETISVPADGRAPLVTIDITQLSSYTFLPAAPKPGEEAATPKAKEDPRRDPLGELSTNLKDMGIEVLDPEKLQRDLEKAGSARLAPPESVSRKIKTEKHVTYQLIYENDRWRLARPPAADAMKATNIAIQQALQRQL